MSVNILLLGHKGMLGNVVNRFFSEQEEYTILTTEKRWGDRDFESSVRASNADIIINCIGMIPQKKPTPQLYRDINVDLPLFLDTLGIRVIHPSTDCEFSGNIPPTQKYTKTDIRDAGDDYGKSKAESSRQLEERGKNTKIIRTSIIGHEVASHVALLDWFLHAGPKVNGYTNHYWNGITTLEWAKRAQYLIDNWGTLPTLNQYGTENTLSKYEMLNLFKKVYSTKTIINPIEAPIPANKCLTSDMMIPTLEEQLVELRAFYNK